MVEVLGYVLASIMGLTLGLIGGGGSILTVPILVVTIQYVRFFRRHVVFP